MAALALVGSVWLAGPATAEPLDLWPVLEGIDCEDERFNPVREDGTRDPDGDPRPGTPEWQERDDERLACAGQRNTDRRLHPPQVNAFAVASYGEDWYRQPTRFDGVRFRFDLKPLGLLSDLGLGIPDVPASEIYRPCTPDTCPGLPHGLEYYEPPYPVVVIFHGFLAQMTHHRFNAQVFAEAGYIAITVNGIHPVTGAPNVQNADNGEAVLHWLESSDSGVFGEEADLDRVAFAGHSQGSAAALSYQNDSRVHAIAAWDGGDGISEENFDTPIMYQRTDGAFSDPQNTSRSTYPSGRDRGLETYLTHKERGLDVMHLTFRATNHIDWNGNGVGILAGNRWAEPVINYYTLAWLDRHLKGRLVMSNGEVVTSEGRSEEEERAFRQAQAQSAYERLIAMRFVEGSIDRFNTSMGLFDPELLIESLDVLYGGNVPYTIEGLWTTNRLATDFRSYCSVSVPDYTGGSDGSPGSAVVAIADSGPGPDDMRIHGCPEVQPEQEPQSMESLAEPEGAVVASANLPVALPATGGGAAGPGLAMAVAALLSRRWTRGRR